MPEWVVKADGRRVPFEADVLCQTVFAATEDLGIPNAFLAREMTDAIVHFLTQAGESAPTTSHVTEMAVKVLRELDQPALAQAFTGRTQKPTVPPAETSFTYSQSSAKRSIESEYALQSIFSRDLVAAQEEGLLCLRGLEMPLGISACVIAPPAILTEPIDWANATSSMQSWVGDTLVFDSPELVGLESPGFIRWLNGLPLAQNRQVIINLGIAEPPSWLRDRAQGPLFPSESHEPSLEAKECFLSELLESKPGYVRPAFHWHLRSMDLDETPSPLLLLALNRAMTGTWIDFFMDRTRRPVVLADGIDRENPAVLMNVDLYLNIFATRAGNEASKLLQKLPSLARMAVSAGTQKRKYLRRLPETSPLIRGFLLDRARLMVRLQSLDKAIKRLLGTSTDVDERAEFAGKIIEVFSGSLMEAGRSANLAVCLDEGLYFPSDGTAPTKQLQFANKLLTGHGCGAALVYVEDARPENLLEILRFAARRTELQRIRFRHSERTGS